MYNFIKEVKGITLIALVITIIVLLILAGVTILLSRGENGILKQAENAKIETEKQEKLEKIKLAITTAMTNEEHKIDKEVLEKELKNNFDSVNIEGEDSLIIEVDGEFYKINANGTIYESKFEGQQISSITGSISLPNEDIKEIVDYKLYGNSVQDEGNIKSVGDFVTENDNKYKISIKVSGKNMFNLKHFVDFYNQYKIYENYKSTYVEEFEGEKNLYKIYGVVSADGRAMKYMEGNFKENTQYTFSIKMYDVLAINSLRI